MTVCEYSFIFIEFSSKKEVDKLKKIKFPPPERGSARVEFNDKFQQNKKGFDGKKLNLDAFRRISRPCG